MDYQAVMFFILTIEQLPELHKSSLEFAVYVCKVLIESLFLVHSDLLLEYEKGESFVVENL
jgi:hypothetical protein